MFAFIFKKVAYNLSILLGVVSIVFLLFNVLPADPARLTLGQRSDLQSLENVRKELNLDKPLFTRYLLYLNDISPLSIHTHDPVSQERYQYQKLIPLPRDRCLALKFPYLGRSYTTRKEVSHILAEALPGTIILAISAMLLATIGGILLGVMAALKKNTIWDTGSIAASVAGISVPSFFAGLIIAYVLGYVLRPYTGLDMTGSLWEYNPMGERRLALENLILPTIALGIRPMAIITQLTRSAMLDTLSQDYIRTAYAKGLSQAKVVWRHALPNSLNPVITSISGWLAELLAGSFFIEYIFGWKGVGKIAVDALDRFDFPLITGSVLLTAFIFIFISFITDVLYKVFDPRVRLH